MFCSGDKRCEGKGGEKSRGREREGRGGEQKREKENFVGLTLIVTNSLFPNKCGVVNSYKSRLDNSE